MQQAGPIAREALTFQFFRYNQESNPTFAIMESALNEAFEPSSTTAPRFEEPSDSKRIKDDEDGKAAQKMAKKSELPKSSTAAAVHSTPTAFQGSDAGDEVPTQHSNTFEYISHPDIEVDDDVSSEVVKIKGQDD